MKKWLVVIFATLVFATPALAADNQAIRWKPVCRHHAIYWASMVAEQYPVRIKYGYFKDRLGKRYYHVQPQLHMGKNWWYFKVVNDDRVVLIAEPTLTLITPKGARLKTEWIEVLHFLSLTDYMDYLKHLQVKGPK
jgi:hypothetical protein